MHDNLQRRKRFPDTDSNSTKDFEESGWKFIPWEEHEKLVVESLTEYQKLWKELLGR